MDRKNHLILNVSLLALLFFGISIVQFEAGRSEDRTVLLRLVPRDPRSLMQGDYMALHYAITRGGGIGRGQRRGVLVCRVEDGVAELVKVETKRPKLNPDEFVIRYRWVGNEITIGPDEYFFQEGQASKFAEAKYAKVAVSHEGDIALLALVNEEKVEIP